jgi:hypothetical protein
VRAKSFEEQSLAWGFGVDRLSSTVVTYSASYDATWVAAERVEAHRNVVSERQVGFDGQVGDVDNAARSRSQ